MTYLLYTTPTGQLVLMCIPTYRIPAVLEQGKEPYKALEETCMSAGCKIRGMYGRKEYAMQALNEEKYIQTKV
jgi:hypothetical protein